ncbi:hypothetical protein GPECTOR_742g903 [Gonium pectorale]|uniref:Uncharacterized protein n=1 Tax=Gonium pectorale TaxID=33097 RepID=A0A150FVB7_GONPE|nr:hypothetical protein GPECTOR_742g903 [Gonium pectorale]|eukprot:KXZ41135.1 hypothetical protein GPECTOR_742g903 [Gonium pectorale]
MLRPAEEERSLRLASLAELERDDVEWRSGAADGGGRAVLEAEAVATDAAARRCEQVAAAAEDGWVSSRGSRDHDEVEGGEEEEEEEEGEEGEEEAWGPPDGIGEPARDEQREEREGVTLPGDAQSESEADSSAWKRGRAVEAGASAAIKARSSSSARASNMSLV